MDKGKILDIITKSNVPVSFEWKQLKHPFGQFKRVSGQDYMLAKLMRSTITEEDLSYIPDYEIKKNIMAFGKENNLIVTDTSTIPNNFTNRFIFQRNE